MMHGDRWKLRSNGFLLIVPILIWNLAFWRLLPAGAGGSEPVPMSLQWAEHLFRAGVFGMPAFLKIQSHGSVGHLGWAIYLVGSVVYFASWLPWLRGVESEEIVLLLAPYLTPMLVFTGIAILCRSRTYACVAFAFVGIHVSLGLIRAGIY